jgi:hypothetical protein
MAWSKKGTNTALVPVDDVVGNLPFIVRRDHRIVAAFAKKKAALDWVESRSCHDESKFTVHTVTKVINSFQDGNSENESDDD